MMQESEAASASCNERCRSQKTHCWYMWSSINVCRLLISCSYSADFSKSSPNLATWSESTSWFLVTSMARRSAESFAASAFSAVSSASCFHATISREPTGATSGGSSRGVVGPRGGECGGSDRASVDGLHASGPEFGCIEVQLPQGTPAWHSKSWDRIIGGAVDTSNSTSGSSLFGGWSRLRAVPPRDVRHSAADDTPSKCSTWSRRWLWASATCCA
mmetsp:Transcript_2705/g.8116  ORF Transcript_2705/g.8116 Transcript_2705/m.8116 type:complete len:217 (-) Transcript_2705:480-1130(-)